mgnify:CR=1 FL=1
MGEQWRWAKKRWNGRRKFHKKQKEEEIWEMEKKQNTPQLEMRSDILCWLRGQWDHGTAALRSVSAPSLEVPKAMDGALGSVVYGRCPAHHSGWKWMDFKVPSNPAILWFHDSMIPWMYLLLLCPRPGTSVTLTSVSFPFNCETHLLLTRHEF